MKDWHDDRRVRHDVITIPVLWLAIALSLLVHVAALLGLLPRLPLLTHNAPSPGDEVSAPLTATLAGPSTPVPESRPPTVVAEAAPTPPPAPAPQPRPKPAPKPRVRTPPPPPPMTAPSAPVAIAPPVTPAPPPVEPTPEPPHEHGPHGHGPHGHGPHGPRPMFDLSPQDKAAPGSHDRQEDDREKGPRGPKAD